MVVVSDGHFRLLHHVVWARKSEPTMAIKQRHLFTNAKSDFLHSTCSTADTENNVCLYESSISVILLKLNFRSFCLRIQIL